MIGKNEIDKLPRNDIPFEIMKQYEGEYIIIFNKKIVEHSKNISEILKLSEIYPKDKAIITKVFSSEEYLL